MLQVDDDEENDTADGVREGKRRTPMGCADATLTADAEWQQSIMSNVDKG
jgi:hypothetical protein